MLERVTSQIQSHLVVLSRVGWNDFYLSSGTLSVALRQPQIFLHNFKGLLRINMDHRLATDKPQLIILRLLILR